MEVAVVTKLIPFLMMMSGTTASNNSWLQDVDYNQSNVTSMPLQFSYLDNLTTVVQTLLTTTDDSLAAVQLPLGDDTDTGGSTSALEARCQIVARFYIDVVIAAPFCLIGIVGSMLSYVALGLDAEISSVTALTLRSLACSDAFLLALWLLHYSLPSVFQYVGIDESLSAVWVFARFYTYPVLFISQMVTVWLTVLIAVCRYVSIGRPLSSVCRYCRLNVVRAAVAVIVVSSVVFNFPRFLSFKPLGGIVDANNVTHYRANYTELRMRYSYRTIYVIVFYSIFTFIVPFLLLTVFSVLLVHAYRTQLRRRAALLNPSTARSSVAAASTAAGENCMTRVIVAVVVVFAVCNFPAKIVTFVSASKTGCPSPAFVIARLTYVLELFNSTANFVIYCVLRRQFRDALRRALAKACSGRKNSNGCNHQTHAVAENGESVVSVACRHGHGGVEEPAGRFLLPVVRRAHQSEEQSCTLSPSAAFAEHESVIN